MNTSDNDMMKLNANEIVFGLKTTKFRPNKNMCFYGTLRL